jgi:hypothetical protein
VHILSVIQQLGHVWVFELQQVFKSLAKVFYSSHGILKEHFFYSSEYTWHGGSIGLNHAYVVELREYFLANVVQNLKGLKPLLIHYPRCFARDNLHVR